MNKPISEMNGLKFPQGRHKNLHLKHLGFQNTAERSGDLQLNYSHSGKGLPASFNFLIRAVRPTYGQLTAKVAGAILATAVDNIEPALILTTPDAIS